MAHVGPIQEESAILRVPVLALRTVTERQEGVEAGLARLVGTNRSVIVSEVTRVLRGNEGISSEVAGPNPYGDGQASERIVAHMLQSWSRVD
jgi:UDP-N-acetylglucosamine 2-epimerase (non-hydrolysing)